MLSVHESKEDLNTTTTAKSEDIVITTSTSSRLIIHKIILENFKSYAGRQEIGPFHKSFSSVVGPNGSGKSNVIDAIMFVLGYRAKKMRQTRLADLIHVSDGLNNIESCTVEVHFCRIIDSPSEQDGYDIVLGSELSVGRTAFNNNRNFYTVNGQTSTITEVTSLLKGHGIDLDHKRFLILQGEVEAIAMMKAKGGTEHEEGLLEYLEDIIGTNVYIPLIEEAAKELDFINETHAEKYLRVKAAETECRALLGEKEEAESFLRLENNLSERKSEFLQTNIWNHQKELVKLEKRLGESRSKLEEERNKNLSDVEKTEGLESEIKVMTKESAELEKKVKKLQADLSKLEQNDVKMQETRKQLKNKLKSLSKQSTDATKIANELVRHVEDVSASIGRLESELADNKNDLDIASPELDRISASLKGVTAKFQVELEAKQSELIPFQEEYRKKIQAMDVAKSTLTSIEAKLQEGHAELGKLQSRLNQVAGELNDAKEKGVGNEKQRKILKKKVEDIKSSIKSLEVTRNEKSKELQMLQSTASEATAVLNQSENGSAVYKGIMKESKAGKIKGIHGRLGDLGTIDAKFDCAIATACSFLDHIVVDTTDVGQKCIEHLRKNNLGRANFIVLDKMSPAQGDAPRDIPNGARRLFDLVKIKEDRYRDAMYFALKDTLVATTLEEAKIWAYGVKRWRVVTLDGKLFETSGTISGGGQVRKGGMNSNFKSEISEDQVRALQEKCQETQILFKEICSSLAKEQSSLADHENQLIKVESEISFLDGIVKSFTSEIEVIQASIKDAEQSQSISVLSKKDIDMLKRLQVEISEIESKINYTKVNMKPIEEAIGAIQQKILDAGGIKYKLQKSKVDGLNDQISNGEKRLSELEKEKVTLERRLVNLKAGDREEEAKAMAKIEVELTELDSKMNEATLSGASLMQDFTKLQYTLEEKNERVGMLKKDMDSSMKAVNSFRQREYELRCSIEQDESRMNALSSNIKSSKEELKKLSLHHLDPKQPVPVIAEFEEADLLDFFKNLNQLAKTIDNLTARLQGMHPNLKVLEEYRQKEGALHIQQQEFKRIDDHRVELRSKFEELRRKRLEEFMAGFRAISSKLKEMYNLITMGGNAELELVDSLDPFSEGVLFSVMPPRKSWKNISNLSGGEKTLSSLALVFALHTYKPTPIYIMDEIDAALDFRNVSIVANYIKERTRDAQFIVISLRNNMFELADRLVGIYKTMQRTKSVTIDPHRFNSLLPQRPSNASQNTTM